MTLRWVPLTRMGGAPRATWAFSPVLATLDTLSSLYLCTTHSYLSE